MNRIGRYTSQPNQSKAARVSRDLGKDAWSRDEFEGLDRQRSLSPCAAVHPRAEKGRKSDSSLQPGARRGCHYWQVAVIWIPIDLKTAHLMTPRRRRKEARACQRRGSVALASLVAPRSTAAPRRGLLCAAPRTITGALYYRGTRRACAAPTWREEWTGCHGGRHARGVQL